MSRAVVALGSNIGDREQAVRAAVAALRSAGEVLAVSSLHETEPVGGPEQPDYLNAVLLLDTPLGPDALLAFAQQVEDRLGRVRTERWGPRTIDIDIVAYDDVVSDDPDLTLPHPRAHERAFVLLPWLEVEPDAVLPDGRTVASLAEAVR